jgi:hypothetical protein
VWLYAVFAWTVATSQAVSVRNLALPASGESGARVSGQVIWEGRALAGTTIYLYRDASLKELYGGSPLLSDEGVFELHVAPGTYYLVAVVDSNRSGTFDAGDALGVYGIRSWTNMQEQKRAITVGSGQRAVAVRVYIAAVRQEVDGRAQLAPLEQEAPRPGDEETAQRGRPPGALRGRVTRPDNATEQAPMFVFAYADPTWRRRVGATRAQPDGAFELALSEGRYYLTVVADGNQSNLFDVGDAFGIYGLPTGEGVRRSPAPISVRSGETTADVEIPLLARQNASGELEPLTASAPALQSPDAPPEEMPVVGRVLREGGLPGTTVVELYNDPALLRPIAQTVADAQGRFELRAPAGEYFLIANADADADGRISAGDGIGGYGSPDIARYPPTRFAVGPAAGEAVIAITARYTQSGQLASVPGDRADGSLESPGPSTGLMGRLTWDGRAPAEAWFVLSSAPEFRQTDIRPTTLGRDGDYLLATAPGTYYLMAIVDATGDEQIGPGDGVAVYGTRAPLTGSPAPIYVQDGRWTPYVSLTVSAVMTDGVGGYSPLDDANRWIIRRRYGEPNDRYRREENGRLVEEWWYWEEGVAFTFVAEGPGWTLADTYRFSPRADAAERARPSDLTFAPSFAGNATVGSVVYYAADGIVWALAPNGAQEPVALGSSPMATPAGVVFRDENDDIRFVGRSGESELVLGREAMVRDLAVSPDGSTIAYTREGPSGEQLRLRNWRTREELVPMLSHVAISSPAWNASGEMVAFAAESSSGASPGTTDIVVYDVPRNHVEPLIEGPEEDNQPVWSPTDTHTLAFTRNTDGVPQVWLATFSETGVRTLRQVTQFGGASPDWLPDGRGLVYETNGQVWTVDLDSGAERPLLVNGEPVLGGAPSVDRAK